MHAPAGARARNRECTRITPSLTGMVVLVLRPRARVLRPSGMVFSPVFAILSCVGLAGAVYVNLLLVLGHFVIVSTGSAGATVLLLASPHAFFYPPRCSGVSRLGSRTASSSTSP